MILANGAIIYRRIDVKNIFTLVAGVIFTVITLPVMAGSLSGDEIKNAFLGKTAVGDHLKKGMGVKSFHAADGSYKRVLSDGSVTTGKWWVEVTHYALNSMVKAKIDADRLSQMAVLDIKKYTPGKAKLLCISRISKRES